MPVRKCEHFKDALSIKASLYVRIHTHIRRCNGHMGPYAAAPLPLLSLSPYSPILLLLLLLPLFLFLLRQRHLPQEDSTRKGGRGKRSGEREREREREREKGPEEEEGDGKSKGRARPKADQTRAWKAHIASPAHLPALGGSGIARSISGFLLHSSDKEWKGESLCAYPRVL